MSTNEILSLSDLNNAVADVAETLLLSDRLIEKFIDWLNRRKLQRIADKIDTLREYCERLERNDKTIKMQLLLIEQKICEIQKNKKFRLTDILTLGVSFAGRRIFTSIQENILESTKAKCEIQIVHMNMRSEAIKKKVRELEERLAFLEKQKYPSLLAKVLKFLQILKHIIFAIINVISGELLHAITELFGLYRSVSSIEGNEPVKLITDNRENDTNRL